MQLSKTAVLLVLLAPPLAAVTPLVTLDGVPEVTVALDGTVVADHEIARHDLGGLVTRLDLGLPAGVALDAFHDDLDGTVLFSLDTAASIGGVAIGPADVVHWDLATQTPAILPAGLLPDGVDVDAVTRDGSDLLLSFDVSVGPAGVVFADEDLVRWDGASFSLAFDGSASGIDPALDLNAAHRLTNGNLLLSFDGAGTVGGVSFADEDVLELSPGGSTWELAFEVALVHPGWAAADLVALSAREPSQISATGVLRFASPSYGAFENQGSATITVVRDGGTTGAVSVTYATSDGTALDGLDYIGVTGTLHWGDGDGLPKSFAVPLLDDALVEGDETVLLELTDPTGGALLGVPATAVLTIIDDESIPPSVLEIPTLDLRALGLLVFLLVAAGVFALRRLP
jgi:hypothetical protein